MKQMKITILLLTFVCALSSCIYSVEVPSTEIEPISVPATLTIVLTAANSPAPTITPLPTLSSVAADELILKMLSTNGDCEYPCWWGIIPGKSYWKQVEPWLKTFAFSMLKFPNNNGDVVYSSDIPDPEDRSWNDRLTAVFYVNAIGIVETMSVPIHQENVGELLLEYGIPPEIWISFIGDFPGGTTEYTILLYYPEVGMVVILGGIGNTVTDGDRKYLEMCSDKFNPVSQLWLWAPDNSRTFYDVVFTLGVTTPGEMGFGRIGEVSNINEEQFYNTFAIDAPSCFRTPYDSWPIYSPTP